MVTFLQPSAGLRRSRVQEQPDPVADNRQARQCRRGPHRLLRHDGKQDPQTFVSCKILTVNSLASPSLDPGLTLPRITTSAVFLASTPQALFSIPLQVKFASLCK